MKKYLLLFLSILTVAGVGITLSSCESDDPPPNPKVNFARATRTLAENAGTLEVEVNLDRASDKDIIIGYDIDGSAVEGVDYNIPVDIGEVEIPAGSTTGVFEVVITNDTFFEGSETIELRIDDAPDNVTIGEEDEMVITITEDDAQPVVSFTETTFAINEDDGGYDLEVSLSAASGQDVTVNYTITDGIGLGHAIDSVLGYDEDIPPQYWDYYINGESGTVVIPAGETTAVIEIRVWTDFIFENTELMVFELSGATGATVTTTAAKKKATGTLSQQDGRGIELYWDNTNANLDLFLWGNTSLANLATITGSTPLLGLSRWAQVSGDPVDEAFEAVFLPTILGELEPTIDAFAVSVLYHNGTVSPLDFEVLHFDFADGVVEDVEDMDVNAGTYTLANLNDFPQAGSSASWVYPKNVQTFERVGGQYTVPTAINEPVSGSRVGQGSKYPIKFHNPDRMHLVSPAELKKIQPHLTRSNLNIRSVRK
jgi:hypothetical protein